VPCLLTWDDDEDPDSYAIDVFTEESGLVFSDVETGEQRQHAVNFDLNNEGETGYVQLSRFVTPTLEPFVESNHLLLV
jgi:hypothetical protein